MKMKWLAWILLAMILLCACGKAQIELDGARMQAHVEFLSAPEQAGRLPGTFGHDQAAAYIQQAFQQMGLELMPVTGQYEQHFTAVTPRLDSLPVMEVVDDSGQSIKSFVHRKDFSEVTSRFASGGNVFGRMQIYHGMDQIKQDASILLLSSTVDFSELDVRKLKEAGIEAVIKQTKKELRGVKQDRLIKSVMADEDTAYLRKEGLPIFVVSKKVMSQLHLDQQAGLKLRMELPLEFEKTEGKNIVGLVEGTDPILKKETLLVTAHYDHLGMDPDGSLYAGALDNASGVALMLELAHYFAEHPAKRTIVFAAFDAEESGLWGSKYFTYHAGENLLPLNASIAINLDMIGSAKNVPLTLASISGFDMDAGSRARQSELIRKVQGVLEAEGISVLVDTHAYSSDHVYFARRGIPAVTLAHMEVGNIHTPDDTIENINMVKVKNTGQMIAKAVDQIANESREGVLFQGFEICKANMIGIIAWFGILALLIVFRVYRRKGDGYRISLIAVFLFATATILIIYGTRVGQEDLPASLQPEPWKHTVSLSSPGLERIIGLRISETLQIEIETEAGKEFACLNESGRVLEAFSSDIIKDSKEAHADMGGSQGPVKVAIQDDQGRVHEIVEEARGERKKLIYRWIDQAGKERQPLKMTELEVESQWWFAADQAMGILIFQDQEDITLAHFPLGTKRPESVAMESLRLHDESGALVYLREFSILEVSRTKLEIVAIGELATGQQQIVKFIIKQGKLSGNQVLIEREQGQFQSLLSTSDSNGQYIAWTDLDANQVMLMSSNSFFGLSSMRTAAIMAVSYAIETAVQGGIVMLTKAFWILPGILILIFATRNDRKLKGKWVAIAIGANLLLQSLVFVMPNITGLTGEKWIITGLIAGLSGLIVWAMEKECKQLSVLRKFILFSLLNLFFLSILYAPTIFESGQDRLDETPFFSTQSEMK